MLISSARLIWLISWATRCETGACDVTHGHEAASADVSAEAWLAAAVAGTASSTTAAQAVSSRDFLDKTRQARV